MRLAPALASGDTIRAEGQASVPQEQPKRTVPRVAAAAAIIILLLAVSVFLVVPSGSPVRSSSPSAICLSNSTSLTTESAPTPNYDIQQVMIFTQTYSQLEFNVTAVAQCDSSGYGPAYLLNGLSNAGYWYQVGVNWDWPLESGGYTPGFGFVSEAWAPGGVTRSPPAVAFSGPVNQGDVIELSLSFSGGQVAGSALDLNTGANGSTSYPSRGATEFVGSQAQQSLPRFSFVTQGYFSGLMTEWYHVDANYSGPEQSVTYSESFTQISSATVGVGELNLTTAQPVSVYSDSANNGNPIDFGTQPNQLQQFTVAGFPMSADAYEFVT